MNVMKMPGFTADASVYRSRGHYRYATGRVAISRGLVPQLKDTDLPNATCGKAPVFGNIICVECTTGPNPTCKTYVCDKEGNNCQQTVRFTRHLVGSFGGVANVRRL